MNSSADAAYAISIIIVSDFELSTEKSWQDEIRCLAAFRKQDFAEPYELILVENSAFANNVAEQVYQTAPQVRVLFTDEQQSAKLKDYAVAHTDSPLIAVVEADCTPNPQWLRTLVTALREHPDYAVASGRTWYGDSNSYQRCLNLMHRAFDDYGKPSESKYISNNGAVYRRDILQHFPYPDAITPFLSSRERNRQILKAGHRFFFHPQARMQHAIGAFDFFRDVHRNVGYADMMGQPSRHYLRIPLLFAGRSWIELRNLMRLHRQYLKWYDWLLLPLLMLGGRLLEIPGMLDAIHQRQTIPNSAYR